ncbi:SART-1 family protein DOT2-like isoform X1 [Primulina tabacum]|uniref:SART-1 family protein DOT2-like isoform X1 n=1 Tax=Primulina tabacum TaxID=48773 RepID=UPI003F5A7DDD
MLVEDDTPTKERWTGDYDDSEGNESDEKADLGKQRSKDNNKNNGHREEKDYKSRDKERLRMVESSKEREKENKDSASNKSRRKDRDERVKDEVRDRVMDKDVDREKRRERERDKERRDRGKEKEQERRREKDLEKDGDRGRDTDRGREKIRDKDKDKDKDREKERDRAKDKEREKQKDREREKDNGRERFKEADERDKGKEKFREKEKQTAQEKDRARDRGRSDRRQKDGGRERSQGVEEDVVNHVQDHQSTKEVNIPDDDNDPKILQRQQNSDAVLVAVVPLESSNLEERILKMREERLKKPSEGASEVLSWVKRSRKIEQKTTSEKERALQLSKVFEEQDNMNDEGSDDEKITQHTSEDLGGVKILHGLDKVLEGGAVVLTLKDQNILADSDVNQEVDMLENVEIGEQKRRDEAYRAAKKKTGVYDDKFNDEPGVPKKMLSQYDDPVTEEGVTLDSSGRFTGEAERKLEELRKRIQGVPTSNLSENLNSIGKISTDYYTEEEMMKFKKPKKKKSLRKKDKLDLNALEAEAISSGLGAGDLGSRSDGRRQNLREEQERMETEKRSNAYQSAYAKADEASKALRREQINFIQTEEDDTFVFGDDDDELRKSLERARKIALKKQDEKEKSAPHVANFLATSTNDSPADNSNYGSGDQQENKVVFTEVEEFVWGLQIDEDAQKFDQEDVFMEEDAVPDTSDQEMKDEDLGWAEVKETAKDERPAKEEEEVVPDETIHESAVGKGLAGALKLLKDRGTLKETIEWGGRNMDKKKSKLVGIYDNDGAKEILIERTDEYGRILTPKESFRLLSHKFHGKGPGKMKQEKRMRQYQEELKVKQMKNADTPSLSVERMRDAQAKLQTPYLVLSGNVKTGQTIDTGSGFATVEKDLAGGLTPMLGNRKVEHFLNIKRKSEPGDAAAQKKPKT